ncbi:Capsanthin/capsorubin synthase, chromoplastic [Seminavis robusta]|uniref:lycopene beta-cyclase n=1 Tax=Seminavis robusta TaxID=568900 RepID=A0A9N8HS39_9STRA|nr:Capsanthin/capsorubin synthase, chromoplastic [Seminavis robusta]|eukprot:Sro1391_g268770.1 Capsanthin/capsorubin synthase, chromoplastic (622) ;mRNA; r:22215-24154
MMRVSVVVFALVLVHRTTGFLSTSTTTRTTQSTQRALGISSLRQPTSSVSGSRSSSKAFARTLVLQAASTAGSYDDTCDVLVLGSGPAGRAIASLLSSPKVGMDVLLADTNFDKEWVPNYGVWTNEWDAILEAYKSFGVELKGGLVGGSIKREWPVTDCYFGGSFDIPTEQRMRLDRPYKQVDKNALRDSLTTGKFRRLDAKHFSTAISPNIYSPAGSLVHDEDGSTIQLEKKDGTVTTIRSKLIVDTTGHETKLVLRDTRDPYSQPGFQIAYGALVEVDETSSPDKTQIGPYDKEAMTLFDYRTDHFNSQPGVDKATAAPTFMYAMPIKDNQIFFEETSLVARPGVSLQECKDRYKTRLEHHGIKVTKVLEEEFCYIPMGGALPVRDQRVMGLGGSAAMVHPSTGYHLCRCMMGATKMADAIQKEMASGSKPNLDKVAASAYHSLWTPENIRQRNFAVFGGEFLMKQDVVGLRGFFDGFFKLPLPLWGGFLAGWPGLPFNDKHESWFARMWFGLSFIVRLPLPVALDMATSIAAYTVTEGVPLPQSVTPFLGEPNSYEYDRNTDNVGDVAVKAEARRMITESTVTEDLPVAFNDDGNDNADAIAVPIVAPESAKEKVAAL